MGSPSSIGDQAIALKSPRFGALSEIAMFRQLTLIGRTTIGRWQRQGKVSSPEFTARLFCDAYGAVLAQSACDLHRLRQIFQP
jgi:hypothetical protein